VREHKHRSLEKFWWLTAASSTGAPAPANLNLGGRVGKLMHKLTRIQAGSTMEAALEARYLQARSSGRLIQSHTAELVPAIGSHVGVRPGPAGQRVVFPLRYRWSGHVCRPSPGIFGRDSAGSFGTIGIDLIVEPLSDAIVRSGSS
jgi:hypothetical protein